MGNLNNIHPGQILKTEFLDAMNISVNRLAKGTFIAQSQINQIVSGKRVVSVNAALRFSKFFGTSVSFWINLQLAYDMEQSLQDQKEILGRISPFRKLD